MDTSNQKKILPHVYAFIGNDGFSIAEKMNAWKKAFAKKHGAHGIHVLDCGDANTDANQLRTILQGSGLFQSHTLVIIKNPWSAKNSSVQTLLAQRIQSLLPTHFLMIADESMDGRTALARMISQMEENHTASVEHFSVPSGPRLHAWISSRVRSKNGSFEKNAAAYFTAAYASGGDTSVQESNFSPQIDLWSLDSEIRKLVSYAGSRPITSDDISAVASLPAFAHIFQLTDSLLEKKHTQSFRIAHCLIGNDASRARGELLSLVSFLISQFHSFVVMKNMEEDGRGEQEVADRLSWNRKRVWVVSKKIKSYSCASLLGSLHKLLDYERIIKTGGGDPALHLDLLIHSLAR
jgi:DNA polymerase III delta subunit